MDTSDSPVWLPFPFHGATAYRVGYCWCHQQTRWGLPSSQANCPDIPLPIHRRVLRRCPSKSFTPSMAFAQTHQAGLPLDPRNCSEAGGYRFLTATRPIALPTLSQGNVDDAAGFTLCYGLPGCDDIASTVGLLLAPDGHYGAAWPLPRPDFHRLADLSFTGHATFVE